MSVVKMIEIKASSKKSFEDAIKEGIARAKKTIEGIRSAWIKEQEVILDERGNISEYRVLMKITFEVKD